MKVGFISLGCSKNLIDTEMGIGVLKNHDFEIVNDPKQAEMIIVNTCGFIESAKEEAINTILEMAEYKKENCKYLVAMGCLVKRYKAELQKAIPEVDLWINIDEYNDFWKNISTLVYKNVEKNDYMSYRNRIITTGKKMAYLKIAEGCDNFCTYCAIPYIRGRFVSRKLEDILEEAKELAKSGIEEVILIAQDTTKYGIDLYGELKLPELLKKVCMIKEFKWVRFLYAYPESITDELIEVVKKEEKICKYFDIPIQHFSDDILKKMNRKTTGKNIINIINRIREEIPEAIIRTSLIVGFPGETEEDFICLEKAVKDIRFDRLGCFTYSKEDGTPAAKFENQVHSKTKEKRRNIVMRLQNAISEEKMQSRVGEVHEVLICDISDDGLFYVGRSYMDSPDTDGVIYISGAKEDIMNKFVRCKIVGFEEYDLFAEVIE
ncbi:MAG: 30S ribosomal protein S12 methylthiotransferase RimO [Clostridia bacterium]|jgi:ribosomal protein S12 methylthiotransferase|nr:30S ribosomal protein S12 methylthiotransferase RimO [Clostridia bacterium]